MPKLRIQDWIFRGRTFCCCLPVRMGVIAMSVLGILFGGLLSIICWLQVANRQNLDASEVNAFIVGGLVQTLLLVASLLGFIGVVVRKQLFVQIYAYTIFLHFFLNIAIGIFLIWLVTHFSTTAAYKVCLDTIQDPEAQKQCTGFLNTARSVWIVVTILVLLIEMYGAIIAARYLNQIKSEKRDARTARQSAIKLIPRNTDPSSDDQQQALLLHPNTTDYSREFNPYEGDGGVARQESSASAFSTRGGYGGGSWTHSDIAEAEKARLRRVDLEMGIEEAPRDLEADAERQHQQDMKTPAGPPPRPPPTDSLPRYSLTDTPAGR